VDLETRPLARTLGCSHETYQILDFYHVTEHLQALLMPLFSQDTERKKMVQASPVLPKRGKITALLEQMTACSRLMVSLKKL